MDLQTLEYFLVVAREENISRAANIIHISQPTLSRQLMHLEEEVGKKLFVRGNRNVSLTDEGRLLKERAEEILELAGKAMSELSNMEEIVDGEICIGSGETDAFYFITDIISKFMQKYPNVKYNIFSGNTEAIKERMDKGLVDIGFLSAPIDVSKYECLELSLKENWGILVKENHSLASKQSISLKELLEVQLICPQRFLSEKVLSHWFQEDAEKINIVATYNLINNAIMLLQSDVGVVLCIGKENYKKLGLIFIPLHPAKEANPILAWRKNHESSLTFRKFIEEVRDAKSEYQDI